MTAIAADAIARAYVEACHAELEALKPGNVHVFGPDDASDVADFRLSADVSAPAIAQRGARVGRRIRDAVVATRARVGWNTNLGIILLCAPIAAAAEGDRDPCAALATALDDLDIGDAEDAFAAIRLAAPGGLGRAAAHDVADAPRISLRAAMAAAAGQDRIAHAYVSRFADVFDIGLPSLRQARSEGLARPWQAAAVFMAYLAAEPDTHIARKFGKAAAEKVLGEARALLARMAIGPGAEAALLAFDADLKRLGLNPGTSADFTVATLLFDNILALRGRKS